MIREKGCHLRTAPFSPLPTRPFGDRQRSEFSTGTPATLTDETEPERCQTRATHGPMAFTVQLGANVQHSQPLRVIRFPARHRLRLKPCKAEMATAARAATPRQGGHQASDRRAGRRVTKLRLRSQWGHRAPRRWRPRRGWRSTRTPEPSKERRTSGCSRARLQGTRRHAQHARSGAPS